MDANIFLKVETVAQKEFKELTPEELKIFKYATSNWSDSPDNMDDYDEKQYPYAWEYFYNDKAPLMPEFNRIIAIGLGSSKGTFVLVKEDEIEMLNMLNDLARRKVKEELVTNTISISQFDINTIVSRMRFLNIKPHPLLDQSERKPWEKTNKNIIDIYKGIVGSARKFPIICYALNININNDINGKDIANLYRTDIDKLKEYTEDRIKACIKCYKKLFFIT